MAIVSKKISTFTVRVNDVVGPPPTGTELADAALALAPGDSVSFSIPTWGSWGAILTQTTRFHWDAATGVAWFWGQDAGYGSLIKYTASTNSFSRVYHDLVANWGGTSGGRGYDATAMDAAGNFYILPSGDGQLRRFNGTGFDLVGNALGATTTSYYGLAYHPDLYGAGSGGFIHVRGSYIRHLPLAGGTWATASGDSVPSSTNFATAIHVPALSLMYASGASNGTLLYRIDAGDSTPGRTASAAPPMGILATAGASTGRLIQSPNALCLLQNATSGQIQRLSPTLGVWELQTGTHPLQLTDSNWAVCYLSDLGILWALRQTNSGATAPNSILYRFPAGY